MLRDLNEGVAVRLKQLRMERGWSLDDLSHKCGVSRASLSRLEKAEVSATAEMLGKVCSAYGLPLSRLLAMVEENHDPLMRLQDQPVWSDPKTQFTRVTVSPPAHQLSGEVLRCTLPPNSSIAYDGPPRPGLEHHLVLQEGSLTMDVEGSLYELQAGDCLRYRLYGPTSFKTGPEQAAVYYLFLI
ncbi:helix-turn-helix domain-containing protein [Pseudovibrio exalbescens]|uniref:helix-turn-helix domain-containing protein n=1 Tax=Pseudovibrio exalbescens TaxID=197461 RepID=UPI000C9AE3F1|nr:XRE family transcriptional regulator [Pseudovibrio exalbescens]